MYYTDAKEQALCRAYSRLEDGGSMVSISVDDSHQSRIAKAKRTSAKIWTAVSIMLFWFFAGVGFIRIYEHLSR